MYDGNYTILMAQYNRWMNQKIYAHCSQLSDEELKRDRGAFFKSIHATLNHIMYGDKAWMGRFVQQVFTGAKLGDELYSNFDDLRRERERMDEWILEWAGPVDSEWLQAPFAFTSGIDGKTRTMPAWTLVTQMFNHQTHHRGQVSTLLTQMGIDPGSTDIPWTPELMASAQEDTK